MSKTPIGKLVCLSLLAWLAGCVTSPTGMQQLRLFPEEQMAQMGITAFEEARQQTPVTKDSASERYVRCVASAITAAANVDIAWEVQVFESDQANAFAVPGGKIGVYTGLLDVARNQDQLAAVIGHEVSHVIAQHGNARVSAAYATQAGLQLAHALAGAASPMKQQLLGLLGLGAQFGVLLPYGRGQETEADILGLDLMAQAGFDPGAAIGLWENMRAAAQGNAPPPFMSTHPSHDRRIETLRARLPHALALRADAERRGRRPSCR